MKTVRTRITKKLFEYMLNLPEGVTVHSVDYDFMTGAFQVRLDADHFEISDPKEDGGLIDDPFVLPSLGEDNKPHWPTLEKKQT